jgi:H+-translocating NAD(P) transhydrogenase subunit beta
MFPQLTIGAIGLLEAFLFMSGLGMVVVILASLLYVWCVNGAQRLYFPVDSALAVFSFAARSKAAMPSTLQMMALYNGVGGGAVCAIAAAELFDTTAPGASQHVATMIGALIGAISLSGSLIAWAKLRGGIDKTLPAAGRRIFGRALIPAVLVIVGCIALAAHGLMGQWNAAPWLGYLLFGLALVSGVLVTLSVGRARMPVVLSVYNAVIGLAVGLEGFVLQSPTLMIAGSVVAGVRLFLTLQMTDTGSGEPIWGTKSLPSSMGRRA